MSDQQMSSRTVSILLEDNACLQAVQMGAGEPVFFISGLSGAGAFWRELAGRLPRDFQSIAFDQRGIGQSSRGTADVTIEQLARDCVCVLDGLGVTRAHVVGHSTGGCIAMALARAHPDRVHSLTLSGTWAGPNAYMNSLFGLRLKLLNTDPSLYEAMGPYLMYQPDWLNTHPSLLSPSSRTWSALEVRVVRERIEAILEFDCRPHLHTIATDCLILGAEDDLVVPRFLQDELQHLLPKAQRACLAQGGHFYPITCSAETAAVLVPWFRSIPMS